MYGQGTQRYYMHADQCEVTGVGVRMCEISLNACDCDMLVTGGPRVQSITSQYLTCLAVGVFRLRSPRQSHRTRFSLSLSLSLCSLAS